jgi:hypothetical protein
VFSRHFQQYFSYIVADLLLHDSVLYGEHCQYSNSHYQTLFITFELISSQTVLNSNRSIMSIPDEQTIEDTKRVIKNGSRSKSSTVPQLYPVELTLAGSVSYSSQSRLIICPSCLQSEQVGALAQPLVKHPRSLQ